MEKCSRFCRLSKIGRGWRELPACRYQPFLLIENFRLGHGFGKRFRRLRELIAFVLVSIRHGQEHAPKAGPPLLILRPEISAAEEGPAIGHQESRERPAALPADGADCGLVARVHIGMLVAVLFYVVYDGGKIE